MNWNRGLASIFPFQITRPLRRPRFVRLNGTKIGGSGRSVAAELFLHEQTVLGNTLRVDHAGEVAANYIYRGQMSVLGNGDCRIVLQEMWDQEKRHLQVMNALLQQHAVRPTILLDIAKVAGFGLGFFTALMGREAAMACTEAVETVIGEHYDDQMKELSNLNFSSVNNNATGLIGTLQQFRDEELEHLDTAVENMSQRAPAHALLSYVVGEGCKLAIKVCKIY